MLYAILCYHDEKVTCAWSKEQDDAVMAKLGVVMEKLSRQGKLGPVARLLPTTAATTLRKDREPALVVDGPFAETKELIAGYWLWQVKDMDEAVAWLKRCPNPHAEACEVEIRPVFEAEDFGAEFTPELREQEERLRTQLEAQNKTP